MTKLTLKTVKELATTKAQKELAINQNKAFAEWFNFIDLIKKNQSLQKFLNTPEKLAKAYIDGLSLGLSFHPAARHVAIVPYGNQLDVQPQYQGLIFLAYQNLSDVQDIFAEIVWDCDEFKLILGQEPTIIHKPKIPRPKEAQPIGVYAVIIFKNDFRKFVFLNNYEVEAIKKRAKTRTIWDGDFWAEMWKKTAIRRLLKTMPITNSFFWNAIGRDDSTYNFEKNYENSDISELEEAIIINEEKENE